MGIFKRFKQEIEKWSESGYKLTSHKIRGLRWKTCQACSKFNRTSFICSQCKCFMPVKTSLQSSKCPLDKWDI